MGKDSIGNFMYFIIDIKAKEPLKTAVLLL